MYAVINRNFLPMKSSMCTYMYVCENYTQVVRCYNCTSNYLCLLCLAWLQVCWAMLAITVAIRIDVYGVIYAVVLGVLFMAPRFILRPIWFIILPLHGILLAVQYFFLLGAPPSVCYNEPGSTGTCTCTL